MAVMSIRRLLLNMAWLMMLSMLIQTLYNLVDSMFVARLSSDEFIVLALVYPIQILMIAVCVGTGMGFSTLLARRLGEGRPDEANRVVASGYFAYLVCWVIFLVLGMGLAPILMGLFTPGQLWVIDYGIQYFPIVTGVSAGICMQSAGERTLQAIGNTVGPMVTQGIGAVVSLTLDPLLTLGIDPFPRMEVIGAALATVPDQMAGVVVGLCMVRRNSIVRLSFRDFRPDNAITRTMFRIGVPATLVQVLATVMSLGMNLILPLLTASGVLILGAYFKFQSFLFMPVNDLNNAFIPIVSFNYGARQRSRITGVIHLVLVLSAAIMATGTVAFLAIPGPFLCLFSVNAAVLAEGISTLRLIALSFVYAGVSVILCAALQALEAANSSLAISLLHWLVFLFPLALLLDVLRPSLVWLALLLSEGAACLTTLLLYRRTTRGRLAGMEGQMPPLHQAEGRCFRPGFFF